MSEKFVNGHNFLLEIPAMRNLVQREADDIYYRGLRKNPSISYDEKIKAQNVAYDKAFKKLCKSYDECMVVVDESLTRG